MCSFLVQRHNTYLPDNGKASWWMNTHDFIQQLQRLIGIILSGGSQHADAENSISSHGQLLLISRSRPAYTADQLSRHLGSVLENFFVIQRDRLIASFQNTQPCMPNPARLNRRLFKIFNLISKHCISITLPTLNGDNRFRKISRAETNLLRSSFGRVGALRDSIWLEINKLETGFLMIASADMQIKRARICWQAQDHYYNWTESGPSLNRWQKFISFGKEFIIPQLPIIICLENAYLKTKFKT